MSAINIGASVAGRRIFAAGIAHNQAEAQRAARAAEDAKSANTRAWEASMAKAASSAEQRLYNDERVWVRILNDVCERENISRVEIFSDRRERHVVRLRHEIWWRIRQETTLSMPTIGRLFRKDHTTVLYGIRRHEELLGKRGPRVRPAREAGA